MSPVFITALASDGGVAVGQAAIGPRDLVPLGRGVALRIMPLGARITCGVGSSDGNGYREAPRAKLKASNGNSMNMVGSRAHGTTADKDVESRPGKVIDEVSAKADAAVPHYKLDVVLVNLGTNDAI